MSKNFILTEGVIKCNQGKQFGLKHMNTFYLFIYILFSYLHYEFKDLLKNRLVLYLA